MKFSSGSLTKFCQTNLPLFSNGEIIFAKFISCITNWFRLCLVYTINGYVTKCYYADQINKLIRETFCSPSMYAFSWLFAINSIIEIFFKITIRRTEYTIIVWIFFHFDKKIEKSGKITIMFSFPKQDFIKIVEMFVFLSLISVDNKDNIHLMAIPTHQATMQKGR